MNYRTSAISTDDSAPREVRAGDRLPEFKVCVGRRETYLADLLDSTRLTLLVAGSGSGEPAELLAGNGVLAPWRTIIGVSKIDAAAGPDFAARFQRAFGPTGGVCLVRPDAYIRICRRGNIDSRPLHVAQHVVCAFSRPERLRKTSPRGGRAPAESIVLRRLAPIPCQHPA